MVWGLYPADPLSGEDKYFIFRVGAYKVGRKGCHVIINKDKGVSRIHAEIIVEGMTPSNSSHTILIRDCSKYGTFVDKRLGSKEKIHQLPNKQATLKDGDLVYFGTGNAAYRFCFVPLIFFVYHPDSLPVHHHTLNEKISSIGARVAYHMIEECTHVLVDELMPVKEDLVDAIVAKKPIVLSNWVELIAEKGIESEIPCWTSFFPTLTVDGIPVKVADSGTRAKCLEGYTCLLESIDGYKFRNRLQPLLEVGGAKIVFIEQFCSSSQGLDSGETNHTLCVIPHGSAEKFDRFCHLGSLYRVKEVDLIRAVLSGHLDSSLLMMPSVLVSSSCSTEETVVADSDDDNETATSVHPTANFCSKESPICINKEEISGVYHPTRSKDGHNMSCIENIGGRSMTVKKEKVNESDTGNADIIYSQDLITKGLNLPATICSISDNGILNFKRFKKRNTQSGNSFNTLIPFSKYPYKSSDMWNEETLKSVNEEKKRKQMEAIAEDLFINEKGRRRGVAGSLHGLLAHRT